MTASATVVWVGLLGLVASVLAPHQAAPLSAAPPRVQPDERVIRSLRSASNQAIQARNLTAFGATMLPDIVVTRGNGAHVSGRDSVLASVAAQFKDPNFLGYVRQPDRIRISSAGPLAAEEGHWTGRFRRSDGIQLLTGVYLSMWQKTDAGWKIRSELFVSLQCTGSAECGK